MKITKRGLPPSEEIWLGECRKCGSQAEAARAELNVHEATFRDDAFAWHECPVCGAGKDETGQGMLFYKKAMKK